jgi:hypothetical protein
LRSYWDGREEDKVMRRSEKFARFEGEIGGVWQVMKGLLVILE